MIASTGNPDNEAFLVLAQELMRRAYGEEDPHAIAQWLITQATRLGISAPEDAVMTWPQSFEVYQEIIQERLRRAALPEDQRRELTWPWASWNRFLDPLEPGMLATISAADGTGKTVVAEVLAESWARGGHKVVFMHFELNRALMLDRRAARITGVARRNLKAAETMTPQELAKLREMDHLLTDWPGSVTYVHTPGWTADRAIQVGRTLRSEGLCDVLVVDYLEKIAASSTQARLLAGSPFGIEANNVELFKNFGETAEIPVVMLAQMNKAGKGMSAKDLDRTAMRGAGEKSEKANIVVLLHRATLDDGSYSNEVTVKIAKNTLGATGNLQMMMNPQRFSIGDPEDDGITAIINR